MEAWKFVPVAPSLYHSLKHYKDIPIGELIVEQDFDDTETDAPNLQDDDEIAWKTASAVWSFYKNYSVTDLVKITHESGRAWDKAWADGAGKGAVLDDDDIKASAIQGFNKYFSQGSERKI